MSLTIANLEKCFEDAKEYKAKYVALMIHMDGFPKSEIIINTVPNFDKKLEYYKKTYDENLYHKFASGICIVGMTWADSFDEIEFDLLGEWS